MGRLIGLTVHTPEKKRAYARQYFCEIDDCPLLAEGKCINRPSTLISDHCPNGMVNRVDGWTPRAMRYGSWVKEWRGKAKELPIESATRRITKVGEWWWLPYAHINMESVKNLGVEFKSYDAFFVSGQPFIHQDNFGPDVVIKLAGFRPQALFGGEITSYRNEVVPQFLRDLREFYPEEFQAAMDFAAEQGIIESIDEIANEGRGFGAPLEWFFNTGLGYRGQINGHDVLIYDHGRYVVTNAVSEVSEFPGAKVREVKMYLPESVLFWPDVDDPRFMRIRARAVKDGVIVEER